MHQAASFVRRGSSHSAPQELLGVPVVTDRQVALAHDRISVARADGQADRAGALRVAPLVHP
jgi:hypothetical protein